MRYEDCKNAWKTRTSVALLKLYSLYISSSTHPPASSLSIASDLQDFGMPCRLELEMKDVISVVLQTSDQGCCSVACNHVSWFGANLVFLCQYVCVCVYTPGHGDL